CLHYKTTTTRLFKLIFSRRYPECFNDIPKTKTNLPESQSHGKNHRSDSYRITKEKSRPGNFFVRSILTTVTQLHDQVKTNTAYCSFITPCSLLITDHSALIKK
ncbi:MAG: hypothetical protein ACJ749_13620, partial [Flavisolibacter sp.]